MRAIENGGKTKQNKKKKIMCRGKERRGSIVRLGLWKRTEK